MKKSIVSTMLTAVACIVINQNVAAESFSFPGSWVVNPGQHTYLARALPNHPVNAPADNPRLQAIIDAWNNHLTQGLPDVLDGTNPQFDYLTETSGSGDELPGVSVVRDRRNNIRITLSGVAARYLMLRFGDNSQTGVYFYIPEDAYVNDTYTLNFQGGRLGSWSDLSLWVPTRTPGVADGGATLALLGLGMVAIEAVRRRYLVTKKA